MQQLSRKAAHQKHCLPDKRYGSMQCSEHYFIKSSSPFSPISFIRQLLPLNPKRQFQFWRRRVVSARASGIPLQIPTKSPESFLNLYRSIAISLNLPVIPPSIQMPLISFISSVAQSCRRISVSKQKCKVFIFTFLDWYWVIR